VKFSENSLSLFCHEAVNDVGGIFRSLTSHFKLIMTHQSSNRAAVVLRKEETRCLIKFEVVLAANVEVESGSICY
jgi:hypothetical protein